MIILFYFTLFNSILPLSSVVVFESLLVVVFVDFFFSFPNTSFSPAFARFIRSSNWISKITSTQNQISRNISKMNVIFFFRTRVHSCAHPQHSKRTLICKIFHESADGDEVWNSFEKKKENKIQRKKKTTT